MAVEDPQASAPSGAPSEPAIVEDPRFASGIPAEAAKDDEAFVRMSGLLRPGSPKGAPDRPAGGSRPAYAPESRIAASAAPLEVNRGLRSSLSHPAMQEEMSALLALQRMESSSRLLEAEQLLQALERQPRESTGPVEPERAPQFPKGIKVGRQERRSPLPRTIVREMESSEDKGASLPRLLRLLFSGILIAILCWASAYYVIGFLRGSVLPDLLDLWSPGGSPFRNSAPPPLPDTPGAPAPQVRQEITLPSPAAPGPGPTP